MYLAPALFVGTGLFLAVVGLRFGSEVRVTTWRLALILVVSLTSCSFVSAFATGWPDWQRFVWMESLSMILTTLVMGWRLLSRRGT